MWRITTSTPLVERRCRRHLFGEKYRSVLSTGAAERDHEVPKTTALICRHACINERLRMREILLHAFLLVEVVNNRGIFSGQLLEAFFASGIGQAARVEDKAAAIT